MTFPGTARHISVVLSFVKTIGPDVRLTEREPAVIWWNQAMRSHIESACGEPLFHERHEHCVLEHSARQRHRVEAGRRSSSQSDVAHHGRYSLVKSCSDRANRNTRPKITHDARQHRGRIDANAGVSEGVARMILQERFGGNLQLDRGLRLIADPVAKTQQRADCVEEPSDA
jgi:hypothetical protein